MSQASVTAPNPIQIRIPLREILPWAIFVGALALAVLFFVSTEAGAVELLGTNGLAHEFVHDGRHLLAFPCH